MKKDWRSVTVGNILQLEYGKPLPEGDRVDDGMYPVYGANGEKGRTNHCYYDQPSIIVGRKGSAGELNLSDGGFWPLDVTYFVKLKSEIDLRFVYYLLTRLDLPSLAKGVKPGINRNEVYAITVSVPGLKEQQRIVAILDEAFQGIAAAAANAERNLSNSRSLFESSLESRLAGGGATWATKPLSVICTFKHGFAFKSEHFRPEGDYVLLTPGNFYERGGYRDRGEKQKYYRGDFPTDFLLKPGDLLVAMTEQASGLLGSPIIVPESGAFLHNQRLGLVKTRPGVPWLNDFFFYAFNTLAFRKAVHDSASGVKVRHTSPSKLGEITISFPQSLEEQKAVVSEMQEAATDALRLEGIYYKKLATLEELKQSLLYQAFSGNL